MRGAVAALGVVALVRIAQAIEGRIPILRAAGELGIAVGVLGVGLLTGTLLRYGGTAARALLALAVILWSAAVLVPLARVAYPAPALFAGRLGGATREVTSAPAPRGGRYLVEVSAPRGRPLESHPEGRYLLHAGAGGSSRALTGASGATPESAELVLRRGQPAQLFLERSDEPTLQVRLRPVPLPWSYVRLGGLLAVLLAIAADWAGLAKRRRLRGLLAAAVAASAIYVALLDPEAGPSGRHALGAAGVAIVGGGLLGAVVGPLGGWVASRGRRRAVR
jgi:hypothetical protein